MQIQTQLCQSVGNFRLIGKHKVTTLVPTLGTKSQRLISEGLMTLSGL